MDEAGVDVSKVEFIELPFPDMVPTLQSGDVDAVWLVEPFQTAADEAGATKLFANFSGPTDGRSAVRHRHDRRVRQGQPEHDGCVHPRASRRPTHCSPRTPTPLARSFRPIARPLRNSPPSSSCPNGSPDRPAQKNLEVWNKIMVDQGAIPAPVDMDEMVYVPGK